jgi:hypothetical protein
MNGNGLGRRVSSFAERELIQILVIETLQDRARFFFQEAEIDDQPLVVQGRRLDGHLDLKIVAVKGFAFPPDFPKVVGG